MVGGLRVYMGYYIIKVYEVGVVYVFYNFFEILVIMLRFGEVLLNYVEVKCELGGGMILQEDFDISINLFCDCVGMVYLDVNLEMDLCYVDDGIFVVLVEI